MNVSLLTTSEKKILYSAKTITVSQNNVLSVPEVFNLACRRKKENNNQMAILITTVEHFLFLDSCKKSK